MKREPCPKCDGDGYVETWNDDQSDVVIALCDACSAPPVAAFGNLTAYEFARAISGERESVGRPHVRLP